MTQFCRRDVNTTRDKNYETGQESIFALSGLMLLLAFEADEFQCPTPGHEDADENSGPTETRRVLGGG